MRLSLDKIESLCHKRGTSLAEMLREAGVSRNAFYTLARKETVVPQSVVRVSEFLDVPVADLLDDVPTRRQRVQKLRATVGRISRKHPDTDPDNVRHTLLLLDDRPIERLRRALRRGRSVNIR